jgi:hypothetical protein
MNMPMPNTETGASRGTITLMTINLSWMQLPAATSALEKNWLQELLLRICKDSLPLKIAVNVLVALEPSSLVVTLQLPTEVQNKIDNTVAKLENAMLNEIEYSMNVDLSRLMQQVKSN